MAERFQVLDVDALLESMTPAQFNRWRAFALVEGWGDEWLQAGTVAAAAHNASMMVGASMAGVAVKPEALSQPEDYVPKPESEQINRGPRVLSDQEAQARAKLLYGG